MSFFRPSIQGLRGIAILWVILFHWSHVRGGFTGVDVFFVISGYLISGQIIRSLKNGTFSFLDFYAKRARRILPSLVILLVFVWLLGFTHSPADDFKAIGDHIKAGALFFTNFQLYQESGYFDAAAESKPLLHLWSLSIEEQFYLLWPVALFVAHRRRWNTFVFTLGITVISFAANILASQKNTLFAFYFLPPRLWELAIGGLVFECEGRLRNLFDSPIIQFLGFGLIIASAIWVRSEGFPGWLALIPVVGAALLLGASENAVINKNILSSRGIGKLGSLSFVLYLWHWPLFSFMKTFFLEDHMALLTGVTILATLATNHWIETPFLRIPMTQKNRRKFLLTGTMAMVLMAFIGALTSVELVKSYNTNQGLPAWKGVRTTPSCMQEMDGRTPFDPGALGPCLKMNYPGRPVVLLIGDSHSNSLQEGLQPFLDARTFNLITMSVAFCPPFAKRNKSQECMNFNHFVESWIHDHRPDVILMATHYLNWQRPNKYYQEPLPFFDLVIERAKTFRALSGAKIMLIGQNPTWKGTLPRVLNSAFLSRGKPIPERTFIGLEPESLEADQLIRERAESAKILYFSMHDVVCATDGCLVRSGSQLSTDLMTTDYGHISPSGARYVTEHGLGQKVVELINKPN